MKNYAFDLECVDGGHGWGGTGNRKRLIVSGENQDKACQTACNQIPGGWDIEYVGTTTDKKGLYTVANS